MKLIKQWLVVTWALVLAPAALAGPSVLFDYGFNINGTVSFPFFDGVPAEADLLGYDDFSGLGTITVEVTGAGDHHVGLFLDLEQGVNFFDETVSTVGTAATGQSWEADEPGLANPPIYLGDIFDNFLLGDAVGGSALDNSIFDNTFESLGNGPEDPALAIAWDFALAAGETATVAFNVAETLAAGVLNLVQTDIDGDSIFFSSTLTIDGGEPPVLISEPAALGLASALLLPWVRRRVRRTPKS